jgi:hypothetical protein
LSELVRKFLLPNKSRIKCRVEISTFRFPENLDDPMNADPAPVRFQDLVLALP